MLEYDLFNELVCGRCGRPVKIYIEGNYVEGLAKEKNSWKHAVRSVCTGCGFMTPIAYFTDSSEIHIAREEGL